MSKDSKVKNIIKTVITLSAIAIVNLIVFAISGHGIPCVFRLVTGFKCPGCGMTHAAYALLRGDIKAALEYNVLGLTFLPLFILYMIFRAVRTLKTGHEEFKIWEIVFLIISFVLVMGYGILRNINPGFVSELLLS